MKLRNLVLAWLGISAFVLIPSVLSHGEKGKVLSTIPHAVITFTAGSAMLSNEDRAALRQVVEHARARGEINHISVAAWSDKGLPLVGQKLEDFDRDLAQNRMEAIKDFLRTVMEVRDVEAYNMAESANWLARAFNTKDAELKSIFAKTGAPAPVTSAEFECIKSVGGPAMTVVVADVSPRK